MAYNDAIPQAANKLLTDQQNMLANFASLQSTFLVDHYGFNTPSVAGDIGKHKTMTTPAQGAAPSAAADEPVMFALDLGTLGVVQLSRSENTAGSPDTSKTAGITALHGTIASLAATSTQDILDCSSLNRCIIEVYAYADGSSAQATRGSLMWDGTSAFKGITGAGLIAESVSAASNFRVRTDASDKIQIQNGSASAVAGVYWTLHIRRYDV